jgi:hypothetical protein
MYPSLRDEDSADGELRAWMQIGLTASVYNSREGSRCGFELLHSFEVEEGLLGEVYDGTIGIQL